VFYTVEGLMLLISQLCRKPI